MAGGAGVADPLGLGMEGRQEVALMLDPSLLLSRRTLRVIMNLAERGELQGAVIPQTLFEFIGERGLNRDVLRFFGGPAAEGEYGRLADVLPQIRELLRFQSPLISEAEMAGTEILRNIRRQVRSEGVAGILSEEWAFLTAHSWIASRIKRPFSAFIKAGAVAIEGSRDVFDRVAARTLKMSPPSLPAGLSSGARLRAISKWVAVGGMSALPFVPSPHLQVLVRGAFGYFLLFDP